MPKNLEKTKLKRCQVLVAVDDQTLVVRLTQPHVSLSHGTLACATLKIIPRAAAQRLGEDFGLTPVGSGPFRFVSWGQ